MTISPLKPDQKWLEQFLAPSLVKARAYSIATPDVPIKLDQNECPWDWPDETKQSVLHKLASMEWNRYPEAYADELADLVAKYVGTAPETVLLAPGSNYMVSLVISMFSRRLPGKTVIARPSFALYESHCQYEDIPYEPWLLDDNLQYTQDTLPELPDGSLVVFASPNNPVGNVLSRNHFAELLREHPHSLFIADEAYWEYTDENYTSLFENFSNFISIRTFSKTLGSAGIRLGYALGAKEYLQQIRKLRLPFLLNHFTLCAAREILASDEAHERIQRTITAAIDQRTRVSQALTALEKSNGFKVIPSEANFVLVRWPGNAEARATCEKLIEGGILIRDVSRGPGLQGCMRVSIGSEEENSSLIDAFSSL